jgi:hypothetical protein
MWLILHRAVQEFGVRENNVSVRAGEPPVDEVVAVERQIAEEALHGALRISALVCLNSSVWS